MARAVPRDVVGATRRARATPRDDGRGDDMTKTTERDGRLEQVGDNWQIQFTRTLSHSPAKVWRALTDPEHRQAWFPDTSIGDFATVGAHLRFEVGGTTFEGEVFEADPPKLLELSWGDDILRFELQPDGTGTVL